jgi:type I restriction enzyme S subunit
MEETKVLHKNKVLTPKLRFKEFNDVAPDTFYKKHLFKDIFNFSSGKNIKQNEASPEFEIPCVRYGELYHMYNEVISEVFNRTNLDKSELIFSEGNEILLPSAGEDPLDIGSASALTIENIAIGRTINILKPIKDDTYSQIYVSYYINEKLRKKISTLAKGVSISNVYNSDLKTLEITLPNLPEQNKVASFLSEVDKKIRILKQKMEVLKQYKKGVMQQLFSGKLRFKDENGKAYPNWEERLLESMCELKNGFAFKSTSYSSEGEYKVVTIKNVQDGYMTNDFSRILSPPGNLEIHQKLKKGDILISMTGNVGRVCRVSFENCLLNQRVGKLEVKNINPDYFYHLINNEEFQDEMIGAGQGAAQMNIGKKDILGVRRLTASSIEEQKKIADFLSAIDVKIDCLNAQITQTQNFKKGLLQQMFV